MSAPGHERADAERLTELEMRFAWLEDLVGQLNELVTAQQVELEALRSRVETLQAAVEEAPEIRGPERPPHY